MKITDRDMRNLNNSAVIWRMVRTGNLVRVMRMREHGDEIQVRYAHTRDGFDMRIPTFLRAAQVVAIEEMTR